MFIVWTVGGVVNFVVSGKEVGETAYITLCIIAVLVLFVDSRTDIKCIIIPFTL